ncbi:hypothetical protein F8388_024719 [Cannabis sativa]|uniref:RNase H type-1 domain-containing protein n=1 Tax=Cannabis sativa TaxID=3483 RepID=A0A7J6GBT9_CANSA|nr:hypothetical protein F8388_024719 [Cannabis sativa]
MISLLPHTQEDRLIWKDATNGEFSPRVAYKSIIKRKSSLLRNDFKGYLAMMLVVQYVPPAAGQMDAYHDQIWPSSAVVLDQIKSMAADLAIAWDSQSGVDLSSNVSNDFLLHGDHVVFIDATSKGLEFCFPLEAETWALLHAVQRCILHDLSNVNFASDCQTLVLGINSQKAPDWKLASVFDHVLAGLALLPELSVTWIPRLRNEMAHRLPKLTFNFLLFGFFNVEELALLVSN